LEAYSNQVGKNGDFFFSDLLLLFNIKPMEQYRMNKSRNYTEFYDALK
jgi:hypothetical protein